MDRSGGGKSVVLYGRDDGPQELSNLEAARRYRLGGYTGDCAASDRPRLEVDLAVMICRTAAAAGRIDPGPPVISALR
jgi:hypothetical protein